MEKKMTFDETVKKTADVIIANRVDIGMGFASLRSEGFCSLRGLEVAEKCIDLMYEIASHSVNFGFTWSRKRTLQYLEECLEDLPHLKDAKMSKINKISRRIDEVAAEAEGDMIKDREKGFKGANEQIDIDLLKDYALLTKTAMDNLFANKIGEKDHFPEGAKKFVPQVRKGLDNVVKRVDSGLIHDVSSHTAAQLFKEVQAVLHGVRANILSRNVSSATAAQLDNVMKVFDEWESRNSVVAKGDRISDKDFPLYKEDEIDNSIKIVANGTMAMDQLKIFKERLDGEKSKVDGIREEIDEIDAEINAIDDQLQALEAEESQAVDKYEADGNVSAFNNAVNSVERKRNTMNKEKDRLERRRKDAEVRYDKFADILGYVRENVYDKIMEFKDSPSLLCEAASNIPFDLVNGVFDGRLKKESFDEFITSIVKLQAKKEVLYGTINNVIAQIDSVMQFHEQLEKTKQSGAKTENTAQKQEELSDKAKQLLAARRAQRKTEEASSVKPQANENAKIVSDEKNS